MTNARGNKIARIVDVVRIVEETKDARSLVLAVSQADRAHFAYRPGQFLTLRIPSDRTGSVARCYSLASAPHEEGLLTVTVKRTADGYASNWLCDNLVTGDTIEVLPPSGTFTPPSLDRDLVLLSGGSGITPVFSILKAVLREGSGSVALFYANRDESSVIFARELRELAAEHADRLTVIHWLESVQGIPSHGALCTFVTPHIARDAYICGPEPFMKAAANALTAAGMPKKRIHTEVYTSLSGNPFDDEPEALLVVAADSPIVKAEVELDGDTYAVDWPVGVPLVDVLLARGIDVPYMCRDGECGSCQATLERGNVRMLRNDILDPEDVADGYVLTCQAVPDGTDKIRIVF